MVESNRFSSERLMRIGWKRFVLRSGGALICVLLASSATAADWPQWRGPNRDGVWSESGVHGSLPKKPLKAAWRAPVKGGYSGPTVAGGRVYLMDRALKPKSIERVVALDVKTGDQLWTHSWPASYEGIDYSVGPRATVTAGNQRGRPQQRRARGGSQPGLAPTLGK